jgi:hypothetical protein
MAYDVSKDLAKAASLTKNMNTSQISSGGTYQQLQSLSTSGGKSSTLSVPTSVYENQLKPAATTAIAADALAPVPAVQMPQPSVDTSAAAGVVAGADQATKGIDSYLKEMTPPETAASKSYSDLMGQINTLLPGMANKSADQLQAEKDNKLPQLKQNLAALNSQILSSVAGYNKAIEGEGLASGETPLNVVLGKQAVIRRNQAADIGLLQARALGLQGQVEMAQETANRAIDLKYDTLKDTISVKMQQLDLIAPILNKEESRFAAALQRKYQIEDAQIADKRDKQKMMFAYALENNVQSPFFNVGGAIYRTSDGKGYATPEEFFADGGSRNFSNAPKVEVYQKPIEIGPGGTLINPKTGEILFRSPVTPNFSANPLTGGLFDTHTGLAPGQSPTPTFSSQTGMRTDRHNNPTAMTTDVARTLGLVEGVDYVKGDPFQSGSGTLYTAKLLGDPIQTTIKALDSAASSSSTQAFYTQSGGQRWSYIGMSDSEWQSLSPADKTSVITKMYQQEGGNGSLVGSNPVAPTGDIIDNLVQQVQRDPSILKTLGSAQQTAVTARMAQMGIPIPGDTTTPTSRLSGSELNSWQGSIDGYFESGSGLGEIRSIIDQSSLPQEDKEALKTYAESASKMYTEDDSFWQKLMNAL